MLISGYIIQPLFSIYHMLYHQIFKHNMGG